jgi:predicted nuclease of predicted toxin-antitoxin system
MSRLLLDENISPSAVESLRRLGHDAVHVNEVGLRGRADASIMLWAAQQGRTVVTHDRDFVDNLRTLKAGAPSVITLVQKGQHGVIGRAEQTARLGQALRGLDTTLRSGALVRVDRKGLTATLLPLAERALHREPTAPGRVR